MLVFHRETERGANRKAVQERERERDLEGKRETGVAERESETGANIKTVQE